MKKKEFFKLFLPPIYYIIKTKLMPAKKRTLVHTLPKVTRNTDRIVIIGNGPSLNESVEKYKDEIVKYDRICVNYFASSDLYEVLKPNIYVFADPAFFWIPANQKESMEKLFSNIITKTNWPLMIIIPSDAKGASIETKLLANRNISINYYNNKSQINDKISKFEAWDENLIGPPAMNVLNVATYLAIYWNYPETYIIGADSSFFENLRVDQETNEVFTMDSHFYKKESVYMDSSLFDKQNRRSIKTTLDKELNCQSIAFRGYIEMAEYAKYKHLRVYNASEYSLIDAFERRKLK